MKLKYSFFLVLLLTTSILFSQTNSNTVNSLQELAEERIYVHYNSSFIVTGETIYYKIYCLKPSLNKPSLLSKIAYIEIINNRYKKVAKHKIKLINGVGQGEFFINADYTSGAYKIICYTTLMKNNTVFFEDNITIINPFEDVNTYKYKQLKTNFSDTTLGENSTNYFTINKKNYTKREKVDITFNTKKTINSSFSLSVRKVNPKTSFSKRNFSKTNSIQDKNATKNKYSVPELRGELLRGKISSKTNAPLKNIKIALSFVQKDGFSKVVSTDKNGMFYFNIDESYQVSEAFLQVLNTKNQYTISMLKDKGLQLSSLNFPEFSINQHIISAIKNRSVYSQINNAYNSKKQVVKIKKAITFPLKELATDHYILDDYKHFNTLKETFVEIILNSWISKKNDKYSFHVRDQEKNIVRSPSLVIIDGFIIQNHSDLIDYHPRKIRKISLIRDKYIMNGVIFQGVIILETYKNNYIPKPSSKVLIHTLFKPQEIKEYNSKNYSKNKQKRIPDYRVQLIWKPVLKNNVTTFSFYTSDVIGDFEIDLQGFTDNGEYISIQKTFSVR